MSFYEKNISQIINDLFVEFGPDKVKIFSFFGYFLTSVAILVRKALINLFLNIFFEIPVKFPLIFIGENRVKTPQCIWIKRVYFSNE